MTGIPESAVHLGVGRIELPRELILDERFLVVFRGRQPARSEEVLLRRAQTDNATLMPPRFSGRWVSSHRQNCAPDEMMRFTEASGLCVTRTWASALYQSSRLMLMLRKATGSLWPAKPKNPFVRVTPGCLDFAM